MTAGIFEFFGGPWDGERKAMPGAPREFRIPLYQPPATLVDPGKPPPGPCFRVGVYCLAPRRDGSAAYRWMGEE